MFQPISIATGVRLLSVIILATSVQAADDAEFAFNLLSDVAPILALFGDQFAKQFTSESLTWVDHLIFAMVPLGIITAITGAIRVQGMQIAKAFIGRARENRALAEIELMSSTSGEVCELFNGNSIVRAMGKPKIAQFLIFPKEYDKLEKEHKSFDQAPGNIPPVLDKSCGIHTLETAVSGEADESRLMKCKIYESDSSAFLHNNIKAIRRALDLMWHTSKLLPRFMRKKVQDEEGSTSTVSVVFEGESSLPSGAKQALGGPPNLQLNLSSDHFDERKLKKRHEIILAAITGVLLQAGLIAIAAVAAFHVGHSSSSLLESKVYGFPCYVAGSILLSLGTGLCSFIIEHSTIEYSWRAFSDGAPVKKTSAPRLVWLQQKQTVNDQAFNGYVISAGPKHRVVTSSRNDDIKKRRSGGSPGLKLSRLNYNMTDDEFWEWLAVGAALLAGFGFTAQFMGLRGLAFPCSIAQLGAIFTMALIRAGIRRRLGRTPDNCPACSGYELDFLATHIVFYPGLRTFHRLDQGNEIHRREPRYEEFFQWRVSTPEPQQRTPFFLASLEEVSNNEAPPVSRASSSTQSSNNFPTSGNSKAAPVFKSATSHQLLRVRERLGDLSNWTSRASASALSLAQSIELVMNTFFSSSSSDRKSLKWLLEVTLDSGDSPEGRHAIRIPLTREEDDGQWKADLGTIDAALSLWMASIDSRRSGAPDDTKRRMADEKRTRKFKSTAGSVDSFRKPLPDWRRTEAGDKLTYSFYRVIGNNGEDEILKRDISWWVDSLVAEQSDQVAEGNDVNSDARKKRNDADLVIGFNGKKDTGVARELGIGSKAPLPIILAQHLFTSFMWTVAEDLPKDCLTPRVDDIQQEVEIEGPHVFNPYDFGQTWLRLKLRHRGLTKLVRQVEAYGLGSTNDILLCMVPALSAMRLLPDQAIAKLIPRVGPGHGFGETATFYNKLLETIKTHEMSIQDKLSVAIVTATMDFLYFAYEPYDQQIRPPAGLEEQLKDIVVKLGLSKFARVMEKLAPVYGRQRRDEAFRKIFQQFEGLEAASQCFETLKNPMKFDEDFAKDKLGFSRHHLSVCHESTGQVMRDSEGVLLGDATIPVDVFGWTPYHYSCLAKRRRLFRLHLAYSGDNVDRLNSLIDALRRSPIHTAAMGGMESHLVFMFSRLSKESQKSIIQASGLDGMTPLHLLSRSGAVASLQRIVPRGEAIQLLAKKDFWGRQPLHIASRSGDDKFATKLLEMGSRSDQLDDIGKTPVDYFLERKKEKLGQNAAPREVNESSEADGVSHDENVSNPQYLDEEDSELFLRFAMKNPDCRYSHGRTFLHSAVELAHESCIRTLLDRGFDIEALDDDRRTPLHYAILAGHAVMAEALIKGIVVKYQTFSANPSAKDSSNTTSLMFAARKNLKAVAQVLLEALEPGAINEKNDDGETALHHALDLEMVEFLVTQQGCDPLATDSRGRTTLHAAIAQKNQDIALYLLGLKGSVEVQESPFDRSESLLVTACKVGFSAVIPEILAKWPQIINEGSGQTPFSWACVNRHHEVVSLLVNQKGIDVNRPGTWWKKYTPLHFAAERKDREIVDLILQNPSAKLHQESEVGTTPLQLAVEKNCPGIVQTLLLDNRTSADARIRYAKELIFKSSSEVRRVFWIMLQSIEDESLVREFLVWLFGRRTPTLESSGEPTNANVSALVAPLARHVKTGTWEQLQDPFTLITLLGGTEIRNTLNEQQVDDRGQDEDKWSLVDYIKRFDRKGALTSFVAHLQDLDLSMIYSHREPTTLLWSDFQESIRFIPCIFSNDDLDNCWNVQDITVVKESSSFRRACIRSLNCIPPSSSHFYFEVEILEDADYQILGIGFCGMKYGLDRMPGWFKGSWGYHGDDGKLFVESGRGRIPSPDFGGPGQFSKGNTVGACLSMETGQGFCTLNGKRLRMGNAFKKPDERFQFGKMYPCIGFSVEQEGVGLRCRVNFGGSASYPFKYDGPFTFV